MGVKVKVCGITSAGDARLAAQAGVNCIGLVFVPDSPRYIAPSQVAEISAAAGPMMLTVGVFRNPDPIMVVLVTIHDIDRLQFTGDETAEFCMQFGRKYYKTIKVAPGVDVVAKMREHPMACGYILDGPKPGSGEVFDWSLIPEDVRGSIILAGGLNPDNVRSAIDEVGPVGLDVCSGVETAPGRKCKDRLNRFVARTKKKAIFDPNKAF
jgi:phosphoribosylanthranilate isomerase